MSNVAHPVLAASAFSLLSHAVFPAYADDATAQGDLAIAFTWVKNVAKVGIVRSHLTPIQVNARFMDLGRRNARFGTRHALAQQHPTRLPTASGQLLGHRSFGSADLWGEIREWLADHGVEAPEKLPETPQKEGFIDQ